MSKIRFISLIAGGLLIINICLIAFLLLRKPRPQRHEGPRNHIIEVLHFSGKQIEEYDKLIDWHRREIRKAEDQILNLKNHLYTGVSKDSVNRQKDSLMNELGKMQIEIEKIHYKHFEDIKALCAADQKKDFEKLSKEIAELFFTHRMHPKGKHP